MNLTYWMSLEEAIQIWFLGINKGIWEFIDRFNDESTV